MQKIYRRFMHAGKIMEMLIQTTFMIYHNDPSNVLKAEGR